MMIRISHHVCTVIRKDCESLYIRNCQLEKSRGIGGARACRGLVTMEDMDLRLHDGSTRLSRHPGNAGSPIQNLSGQ